MTNMQSMMTGWHGEQWDSQNNETIVEHSDLSNVTDNRYFTAHSLSGLFSDWLHYE
jgi:hypothetical protein